MPRRHVETISDHPQTLYRGLQIPVPNDVPRALADPERFVKENLNADQMGIHWTDNALSAQNFALDYDPESYYAEQDGESMGLVLHGRVRPRHIVQPDTDEWEEYAMDHGIFDRGHPEQEVTVRTGSPVNLDGVEIVHAGAALDMPRQGPGNVVASVGNQWVESYDHGPSWYHGRA